MNRREFLQQTVAFSAFAALEPTSLYAADLAPSPAPNPRAQHMLMLGDWGTDKYLPQQVAVAQGMRKWCESVHVQPGSLFMLGDNFYGPLLKGVDSPRWKDQFEDMYPASAFPGPAFAVLGNHDYEKFLTNKVDIQLDYPKHVKTRWTMPAKWYTFQYPQPNPIATFICLDSNLPGTKPGNFSPFSYLMSHAHRDEQDAWFNAELAKPRTTPFLIVVAHHPLYTNGIHGDNPVLIKRWDSLLRQAKVDFYITGHDHDLQHLEFAGHPTSFVVSGAGGAELNELVISPEKRGPWGTRSLGFTDLELSPEAITVRHIGADSRELYAFRRRPGGGPELLRSA